MESLDPKAEFKPVPYDKAEFSDGLEIVLHCGGVSHKRFMVERVLQSTDSTRWTSGE